MTFVCPRPVETSGVALQRVRGSGRLSVKFAAGESRIDRLFQEGSARLRVPRVAKGMPLEAVLINTAGGLTGGDLIDWSFEAGEGASMTLATQACEKTYKAQGESEARVSVRLTLRRDSMLAWLPQETILFDRSRLSRTFEVEMAVGSRLLMVEPVVFGRRAMDETVTEALFRDRWRIRRDGRLLHAEEMRLGPDVAAALRRAAVAGGGTAMATLVMVAPEAEAKLAAVRELIGASGGASHMPMRLAGSAPDETGKLLARIVATDSYQLRKILVPLIRLVHPSGGVPKVWSI
ncbi:urease accessory protein UreD [Hoeflea olei]|uniref:Urease accessory protein UreD n=1 Tax=Hoeflea olei TaxID=1480615 RepID=A0A1C1YPP1_9HYPH|nr:urease accessory protein UreD [Hoeflea olei]OCW55523.1 urease accessory protein UreD [Hoeflea olei]